jgi:hypothetical protein
MGLSGLIINAGPVAQSLSIDAPINAWLCLTLLFNRGRLLRQVEPIRRSDSLLNPGLRARIPHEQRAPRPPCVAAAPGSMPISERSKRPRLRAGHHLPARALWLVVPPTLRQAGF